MVFQKFIDGIDTAFRDGDAGVDGKFAEARNVGILRDQYQALSRGDLDAAVELFHEDVELEITGPPAVPFLGRWRGRLDVKDAIQRNFGMLDAQTPEVHSVVAQGDLVVVVAHEQGRIRATGTPYSIHWVQIFTFRDGKLVRMREIVDGYAVESSIV
ncbi:nuclear transport factor 2 family protein [Paludisphaera borealis]|uniref:SnoaL-like domain-containing protein n=1 Tax=Paludisphaera borealis TaxID=1387353 RepID=A0A1U7CZD5_9BACT|nr:nuclear transport factor 2 family protein [Paludisphaera borealis]APW64253.1 hypothetical protein BSF38_10036 [Paludisphaera borealis]